MSCRVKGCRYPKSHTTIGHLCSVCLKYGHGRMECGKKHRLNIYYNEKLPLCKQCSMRDCKFKMYHTNEAHHCPKCLQNHSINDCPQFQFTIKILKIKCPICRIDNEIDVSSNITEVKDTCCVCMDKKASVIFPKCGHICCCLSCSKQLNVLDDAKIYNLYNEVLNEDHMVTYCDLVKTKRCFINKKESKLYCIVYAGMGCSLYIRRDFTDGVLLGFFLHSDCQGQYGINHIPFANKFVEGYKLLDIT